MAKTSIKNLMMLQEAAPQPQLEKQGSDLKKGLKKMRNGVKSVRDKVKDRTSRRPTKTPGPVPPLMPLLHRVPQLLAMSCRGVAA